VSETLPVLWTPAQQAWLQAMGYTVFHDGELAAALEAAVSLSVAEATPAPAMAEAPTAEVVPPAARAPAVRAAPQRSAPAAPSTEREAQGRGGASLTSGTGTRQPAVRLPDRLQIALLRASGCNPNDPATQALMESWPLEQLRRDPAAKRALWPSLRALRRKARG